MTTRPNLRDNVRVYHRALLNLAGCTRSRGQVFSDNARIDVIVTSDKGNDMTGHAAVVVRTVAPAYFGPNQPAPGINNMNPKMELLSFHSFAFSAPSLVPRLPICTSSCIQFPFHILREPLPHRTSCQSFP